MTYVTVHIYLRTYCICIYSKISISCIYYNYQWQSEALEWGSICWSLNYFSLKKKKKDSWKISIFPERGEHSQLNLVPVYSHNTVLACAPQLFSATVASLTLYSFLYWGVVAIDFDISLVYIYNLIAHGPKPSNSSHRYQTPTSSLPASFPCLWFLILIHVPFSFTRAICVPPGFDTIHWNLVELTMRSQLRAMAAYLCQWQMVPQWEAGLLQYLLCFFS